MGPHWTAVVLNMGFRSILRALSPTASACNNTLLRRVLRRFSSSKCFLEGFLEGCSVKTRFLAKGS